MPGAPTGRCLLPEQAPGCIAYSIERSRSQRHGYIHNKISSQHVLRRILENLKGLQVVKYHIPRFVFGGSPPTPK